MPFRRLEFMARGYLDALPGEPPLLPDWSGEPGFPGSDGSPYDRIVAVLIRKLGSTDDRVALAAEQELLAVGEQTGLRLINVLPHCSWAIRSRLVSVLGKLGASAAIPCLLELFSKAQSERGEPVPDPFLSRDFLPTWMAGLDEYSPEGVDEQCYFRIQTIIAFRAMGGSNAIQALCETLADPHAEVQRFAAAALRALANEQPAPELRSALPRLRQIQANWYNSRMVRVACRLAMHEIERVTVPSEQFPVPAGPLEPPVRSLPLSHPNPVNESSSISPVVLEHEA